MRNARISAYSLAGQPAHCCKVQALMGATRPASEKMQCSYTISKGSQTARITLMSVSLCHKNPDARRVAPISACVWCLRLVVAFFADFINASPNQLAQLTDFQYALCDGAKKVTKPGNEQTLCMSNLYQNPVTNHNTRIYGTNNYTFIPIRGIILYELFYQSPGFMQSMPQTVPVIVI